MIACMDVPGIYSDVSLGETVVSIALKADIY